AYPGFKVPYGETITVQPYWFDAEKVNDPASYDTVLKLAAGKSDRFIKLGEAKTVTLVDPTGLKCETQPGTGQPGPAVPVPQQPAAPTTPAPQPSGKSGNLAKTGAADSTLAIGTAAALLGLGAATIAVRRRKAS
ncbi:LPXTG cell wall anchor domain-containing protein, partial [Leucobacter sp. OH1287]|uniref:LPXTG cell wall anchor domain-containing protein n=1 Tax=Leucobacter sp. OH1287 TaxID=2491049 RepID=UPI000F600915